MTDPKATALDRKPLPGKWRDLLTQGVPTHGMKRWDVVKATRQVMLAMHGNGWSYTDAQAELTDLRNKLAVQIRTGRGGRVISRRTREEFLRKHWDDTGARTFDRPAWTSEDIPKIVQMVRESLEASTVDPRDRAVLESVLDLADEYNTTQVAAPVHAIVRATGIPYPTAYRILMRLAAEGDWLVLAKRGDRRSHRANLYNLAPALTDTYTRALRPSSHDRPMSHEPMSHEEEIEMPLVAVQVTEAELEELLRKREEDRQAAIRFALGDGPSNVTPLRRTSGGST